MSQPESKLTDELEIYFFPLDIDFEIRDNQTIVRLFGVTRDKKRIVVLDKFSPFLYIVPEQDANIDKLKTEIKFTDFEAKTGRSFKAKSVNLEKKKISGKLIDCIKVGVNIPDDLSVIYSKLKNMKYVESVEEYDITLYRRYLTSKRIIPCSLYKVTGNLASKSEFSADIVLNAGKITQSSSDQISDLKVLAIDTETLCEGNFSDPRKDSIVLIALAGKDFKKVISWKRYKDAPDYVTFVDGELELINEVKRTINQFKPDIIVGYGSDNFDFPFLRERAQKYNIKLNFGFDNSDIQISRMGKGYARITGVPQLDIVSFIRNILDLRTERYRLDNVAQELLGKGKLFVPSSPKKVNEMWSIGLEADLRNLTEYNLIDAQLAFELFLEIKSTQMQLVKLIGLPIFDINRMTYRQLVENYITKNAVQANQIIARLPSFDEVRARQEETFHGGFVIEPTPDLYKNIHVLDFRSLYPTTTASHNISPETMNCECCKLKGGYKVENNWFCSREKGFFPTIVQDLIERRRRINTILAETPESDSSYKELTVRRYVLKIIANAMLGYLSYAGSRWYNLDCVKLITSLGRKYIQMVIGEAEKFGFKIIYGDTDSLFLHKKDDTKQIEIKDFLDIINSVLPKPIELEYRDFYPAALFIGKKDDKGGAKKRYALRTTSGDTILVGTEAVRGDWSELAKNVQRTVIKTILSGKGVDEAAKYVQEQIDKVKNRKVDLADLVIANRLTKPIEEYAIRNPHVAAAELAKAKGHNIRAGSVVSFIVNSGEGKISDRIVLAEDANINEYDVDYYSENQILRSVSNIFEMFNYPEEKLKAGQTTLGSFDEQQ